MGKGRMSKLNDTSIVILNYNDYKSTIFLTDLLLSFNYDDFHIIVVDNRSKNESESILNDKYHANSKVDFIVSDINGGYSYGNNYGAKYALNKYNSEYIIIANPDVILENDTIPKLIDCFCLNDNLAMIAPIMKEKDGSFSKKTIKLPNYYDDILACTFKFDKGRCFKDPVYTDYNRLIETEFIPGSFFAIRADVLKEIGFLDDGVFLYCEERILGRKLLNLGYKAAFVNDLFFVHNHGTSTSTVYNKIETLKLTHKSRIYYYENYQNINPIQKIFLKFMMKLFIKRIQLRNKLINILKK